MLNRTLIFSLCIMAALLVASCTNSTSPDIEESLDLFSGLEAITEAQNTNVTINRGTDATDGYFEITVEGVDANPFLAPGAHEAWCLEWHKNLRSNGDVHQDVKWFSTGDNDNWKPLNYLFSIRGKLQANDPDLTFRDIQAVVWVLAGEMGIAPAFDVLNMPVSQIPSRLRAGDELAIDREKVAGIARRVMEEAPKATGLPAGTVAQTAEDEQDMYTSPPTITPCFADLLSSFKDFFANDSNGGIGNTADLNFEDLEWQPAGNQLQNEFQIFALYTANYLAQGSGGLHLISTYNTSADQCRLDFNPPIEGFDKTIETDNISEDQRYLEYLLSLNPNN